MDIYNNVTRTPVAAVFVHAGAGYHSVANEKIHLRACSEAARVAMRFLQNGADSTLAVEAAIKCLEDKEITNAGFGSNLNIRGIVEGDATIVDHLGRSGACGAVPGIKNPISLAKMIRDESIRPLSLSRIPPNMLVGTGAMWFAEDHGMPPVLNDFLVSMNARIRFNRWHQELQTAEATVPVLGHAQSNYDLPNSAKYLANSSPDMAERQAYEDPLLSATWNEGQPSSPGLNVSHDGKQDAVNIREDVEDEHQTDVDMVNDTVGVIAIDLMGHIAAGSSSGGIGMKHTGRVGPAALVGIGTTVIPADPDDEDGVSVAAVTSGSGEHMATSFAALKCAQRLYHCTRRGPGGQDIEEYDDDAVLESFVTVDFMGHPGVKAQPTPGAIGVMAVKQTNSGYYFYFAHNTDSFALASMSSKEKEPLCTMSRVGRAGGVIRGGRKIRLD